MDDDTSRDAAPTEDAGPSGRPDRSKAGPTAADFAAAALECDMHFWLTYIPRNPDFSEFLMLLDEEAERYITVDSPQHIDKWLQRYPPSRVRRSDGIGWICVRELERQKGLHGSKDVSGLKQAWEEMKRSRRDINYHAITELARNSNVLSGKWMVFVEEGPKADILWRKIAMGICEGKLGQHTCAKISPSADPDGQENRHVICVYNRDYTNFDDVMKLESALRSIGIRCLLQYKPDVYTNLGVYRKNEWHVRPVIYRTQYDVLSKTSTLEDLR